MRLLQRRGTSESTEHYSGPCRHGIQPEGAASAGPHKSPSSGASLMNLQDLHFYHQNLLLPQPPLPAVTSTATDSNVQACPSVFLSPPAAHQTPSQLYLQNRAQPTLPCSRQLQATIILQLHPHGPPAASALALRRAHSAHHSRSCLLCMKAKRTAPASNQWLQLLEENPTPSSNRKVSPHLLSAPPPDTVLCTQGSVHNIFLCLQ